MGFAVQGVGLRFTVYTGFRFHDFFGMAPFPGGLCVLEYLVFKCQYFSSCECFVMIVMS